MHSASRPLSVADSNPAPPNQIPIASFMTPGGQIDFPEDADLQQQMNEKWSQNLDGFAQQGITGNPWNMTNASDQTYYFNPLSANVPYATSNVANPVPINWGAFPGRLSYYNPTLPMAALLQLADLAWQTADPPAGTFPPITIDPCSGQTTTPMAYGPYGPRGWLDEYCEWCVTRDANGDVTRIDFTCENPEYWNTLWSVSPEKVASLYRSTLGIRQITVDDLSLKDAQGHTVTDPSTGRPAYDPLNKWNTGTQTVFQTVSGERVAVAGGAMHLTSTPNTIQTEINLAASATVQRINGQNMDANTLICCSRYGQAHRNSDPNIGQQVNQAVGGLVTGGPLVLTLANPPGLYIQTPSWGNYSFAPEVTNPNYTIQDCWKVVRGNETLPGLPGNFHLHAVFQAPPDANFTLSQILVADSQGVKRPLQYGGQIAQTFQMQINGWVISASPAAPTVSCVDTNPPASEVTPQPLQLLHAAIYDVVNTTAVSNPVGVPMTLLSNTTLIAPTVAPGSQDVPMVLTCALADPTQTSTLQVSFGDPAITATITGAQQTNYAVPGNTYPGPATALFLTVNVGSTALPGLHGASLSYPGQATTIPMPALLCVAATGAGRASSH